MICQVCGCRKGILCTKCEQGRCLNCTPPPKKRAA